MLPVTPVCAGDGARPACAATFAAAMAAGCAGRLAGSLVPVLAGVTGDTGPLARCSRAGWR